MAVVYTAGLFWADVLKEFLTVSQLVCSIFASAKLALRPAIRKMGSSDHLGRVLERAPAQKRLSLDCRNIRSDTATDYNFLSKPNLLS